MTRHALGRMTEVTFDRRLYPDDWPAIRQRILDRSANCCEWCGAENRRWIAREEDGSPYYLTADEADYAQVMGYRITKVILTIAHLAVTLLNGTVVSKHDKGHRHEAALAALCQRCHLSYDREDHIRHAAETRLQRKIAAGQAVLIEVGP